MSTKTRDLRIGELRVAAAMHAGVHTCDREAPLSEVAATMARESIHCVVVESGSGEAGPPWGIVSDLDLVAAAMVRDLDEQTAGGSAATPVVMVSPHETLERAAQLMTEHSSVASDRRRLEQQRAGRRPLDARRRGDAGAGGSMSSDTQTGTSTFDRVVCGVDHSEEGRRRRARRRPRRRTRRCADPHLGQRPLRCGPRRLGDGERARGARGGGAVGPPARPGRSRGGARAPDAARRRRSAPLPAGRGRRAGRDGSSSSAVTASRGRRGSRSVPSPRTCCTRRRARC